MTSSVPANKTAIFPQGTIDLFKISITADTESFDPKIFYFFIKNEGGISAVDFDTIQARRENSTSITGSNLRPVTVGTTNADSNGVLFNDVPIVALATRVYIISVTLSDTANFGDLFRAQIPEGTAYFIGTGGVSGDTTLFQLADITGLTVEVAGINGRNALPRGVNLEVAEPFLVGAGSDYFSIIGFTLASQSGDDRLHRVTFRWIDSGETFNFRPGHPNVAPSAEYGDLEDVSIWFDQDGDGKFSTADKRLKARNRKKLFVGTVISDDGTDSGKLDMLTMDSRPVSIYVDTPTYEFEWSFSLTDDDFILPLSLNAEQRKSNRSNFFIAMRTNKAGYGRAGGAPNDGQAPGFVGFGDEYRVQLKAVEIKEKRFTGPLNDVGANKDVTLEFAIPENLLRGDTPVRAEVVSDTVTEIIHNPRLDIDFLDFTFDESPSGELERKDGKGLDFTPEIVGRIHAIGGPANTSFGERMHAVTIEFSDSIGLFYDPTFRPNNRRLDANFRPISGNTSDGIQIWRNANDNPVLDEATDFSLPLDQFNSSWKDPGQTGRPGIWQFRAVLRTPSVLPLTVATDSDASPKGWFNLDNGNVANNQYWVTVLSSVSAKPNDHVLYRIPPGGIEFSSGNLNSQRGSDEVNFALDIDDDITWNVPLIWSDYTAAGQIIGQSSPATPLLGMNMRGGNPEMEGVIGFSADIKLRKLTLYVEDGSLVLPNIAPGDFLPMTNDVDTNPLWRNPILKSGFAIYADNNGAPGNREGFFDATIDTPLYMSDIFGTPAPETGTGWVTVGAVPNALRLQIIFRDTDAGDPVRLPDGDTGPNLGADYFLVTRTSASVSANDRFKIIIGDINTGDGIRSNLTFRNEALPKHDWQSDLLIPFSDGLFLFSVADQSEYQPFWGHTMRTNLMQVSTISSTSLSDLVPPGFSVDREEQFAVIGINMLDGTAGDVKLVEVDVDAMRAAGGSGFNATSDLFSMSDQATAGVALYIDSGVRGQLDAADERVSIEPLDGNHQSDLGSGSRRFILRPRAPIAVPDEDTSAANLGIDILVVFKTSKTIAFGDTFFARIPEGGIIYSAPSQNSNDTFNTNLIAAKVNAQLINFPLKPTDSIAVGIRKPVFGINAVGNGSVSLSSIKLYIYPDTNFSLADLFSQLVFPQISSETSGIALFRDNGATDGTFDATDPFIPARIDWLSGPPYEILLTVLGGDSIVPATEAGADSGVDFHIVFNLSQTVLNGDAFHVGVPSGGISFTAQSSKISDTSGVLIATGATQQTEFGPANIFSPNNNNRSETTALRIQLPVSVTDTRSITVVLYKRNVTSGETVLIRYGSGVDTSFTFSSADSAAWLDTSPWAEREYGVRILYASDVAASDSEVIDLTTKLIVDNTASRPAAVAPPTTIASKATAVKITIVADLTPEAGADVDGNSKSIARMASENSQGFNITISSKQGDSIVVLHSETFAAQTTDFNKDFTLLLPFTGTNQMIVSLTDLVGNTDSSTFSIAVGAATVTPQLTLVDAAGNALQQPIFRYSPSNTEIGFQFQETLSGGTVDIYSPTGDRLMMIDVPMTGSIIRWNGRNQRGTLLRNGIYLVRFNVRLANGTGFSQTRNLFFLK